MITASKTAPLIPSLTAKTWNRDYAKIIFYGFAIGACFLMLGVIGFITYKSVFFFRHVSLSSFLFGHFWNPATNSFGLTKILIGNFFLLIITLLFAVPLTIFTSCFIVEFLPKWWKNKIIALIQILAGIPSVVFGLFALSIIGPILVLWGAAADANLLTAALTLTFMSLPIMTALTVNALESVPKAYRTSAAALGMPREQIMFRLVLKSVTLKVIAAVMLGTSRIIGETMAVLMICGNNPAGINMTGGFNHFIFSTFSTLASIIGLEALESITTIHTSALYAIAVTLIIIVFLLNIGVFGFQAVRKKSVKRHNFLKRKLLPRRHDLGKVKISALPSGCDNKNKQWQKLLKPNLTRTRTRRNISAWTLRLLMISSTCLVIFVILTVLISIIYRGLILMHWGDLTSTSTTNNHAGILAGVATTLLLIVTSVAICVPLAFGLAVYMSEIKTPKSKTSKVLRFLTTTFTATPSIVYGLFGLFVIVGVLHLSISILSASITMVFVLLPMLANNFETALQEINHDYRTVAYAMGFSKTKTLFRVVIPNSWVGISTSIILAIARVIGESAPVYLTLGTTTYLPHEGLWSPGSSLAVQILMFWKNGVNGAAFRKMYEIAFVIMFMIFCLNSLVRWLKNHCQVKASSQRTTFKTKWRDFCYDWHHYYWPKIKRTGKNKLIT